MCRGSSCNAILLVGTVYETYGLLVGIYMFANHAYAGD